MFIECRLRGGADTLAFTFIVKVTQALSLQLLIIGRGYSGGSLSSLRRLHCRGACRAFPQQEPPHPPPPPPPPPRTQQGQAKCFRLGFGGAGVQPRPLVRNVPALGQRLPRGGGGRSRLRLRSGGAPGRQGPLGASSAWAALAVGSSR